MIDCTILDVYTVLVTPIWLKDIIYNCPVCDCEIDIDMIVDDNSFIICDNCEHIIKFKIIKI